MFVVDYKRHVYHFKKEDQPPTSESIDVDTHILLFTQQWQVRQALSDGMIQPLS